MCGRFVGFRNLEQLKRYFPIDRFGCEAVVNYNVSPGQQILVITRQAGQNSLNRYHWGLVPPWAKDKSIGHRMINARSETLAEKPSFRNAFRQRRCLIPADGFYEWTGPKGKKQPVFITQPNEQPFAFAGLWETWRDGQKKEPPYLSCAIITREACEAMQAIHHRMPVILQPRAYEAWLDPQNQDTATAMNILTEAAVTDLLFRPVSTQINSARNNDPSNIRPVQTEFDF